MGAGGRDRKRAAGSFKGREEFRDVLKDRETEIACMVGNWPRASTVGGLTERGLDLILKRWTRQERKRKNRGKRSKNGGFCSYGIRGAAKSPGTGVGKRNEESAGEEMELRGACQGIQSLHFRWEGKGCAEPDEKQQGRIVAGEPEDSYARGVLVGIARVRSW